MSGLANRDFRLTIISGHYGAGKTNLALNLARDLRAVGRAVTLVDLDIVNPYFRSSDSLPFLQDLGIRLLGPVYAVNATNLDTPSLQPGIEDAIRAAGDSVVAPGPAPDAGHMLGEGGAGPAPAPALLIDVGGDPDGARALGRYAALIAAQPYQLLYVVNFNRPETATPELARENLRQIERTSGLRAAAIFANTHLMEESSVQGIVAAAQKAQALAGLLALPLAAIGAPSELAEPLRAALKVQASVESVPAARGAEAPTQPCVYPLQKIVATPWEAAIYSSPAIPFCFEPNPFLSSAEESGD
jgi:hypothetical protein